MTKCGWCLTGDHDRCAKGRPGSVGGKAWTCTCPTCQQKT